MILVFPKNAKGVNFRDGSLHFSIKALQEQQNRLKISHTYLYIKKQIQINIHNICGKPQLRLVIKRVSCVGKIIQHEYKVAQRSIFQTSDFKPILLLTSPNYQGFI